MGRWRRYCRIVMLIMLVFNNFNCWAQPNIKLSSVMKQHTIPICDNNDGSCEFARKLYKYFSYPSELGLQFFIKLDSIFAIHMTDDSIWCSVNTFGKDKKYFYLHSEAMKGRIVANENTSYNYNDKNTRGEIVYIYVAKWEYIWNTYINSVILEKLQPKPINANEAKELWEKIKHDMFIAREALIYYPNNLSYNYKISLKKLKKPQNNKLKIKR